MKQSLAIAYAQKRKKMADGGEVQDEKMDKYDPDMIPNGDEGYSKIPLKEPKVDSMGKPIRTSFAEGGEVDDIMLDRIMKKQKLQHLQDAMAPEAPSDPEVKVEQEEERKSPVVDSIMAKNYSEGGKVSNDVLDEQADEKPAQYDDLVLDDDLSGEQPEESNEHGNAKQDSLRMDMIDKIMASRSKKDKMPRPA